jgi:hypothetical protein
MNVAYRQNLYIRIWGFRYHLAEECVLLDLIPSTSHNTSTHSLISFPVTVQVLLRYCSCAILVCVTVRLALYRVTKCYCCANIA